MIVATEVQTELQQVPEGVPTVDLIMIRENGERSHNFVTEHVAKKLWAQLGPALDLVWISDA